MKNKIKLILIIIFVIIIDQIVKNNVINNFSGTNLVLIKNLITIANNSNTDTAYSLGANSIILLMAVNIIVIYALAKILVTNYQKINDTLKTGICLIIAGEASNLIDMIFKGYEIKIITILKYKSFNLADVSIIIGFILIVLSILVEMVKSQEKQ